MKTRITLLAYSLLCSVYLTLAQPGTLDNTFGTDGKVANSVGPEGDGGANAMAIQSDGKIVVAGFFLDDVVNYGYSFLVVRYNSNGSVDNTFGSNGIARAAFGRQDAYAYAIAIQQDGKIVVAGYAYQHAAVVRLNANGVLDGSFNSGGKLLFSFGEYNGIDLGTENRINAIAIQNDGKIVVAGSSYIFGTYYTGVARINADGHFDGGFGAGGTGRILTLVGNASKGNGMALQADEKIVVAGDYYTNNSNDHNFFVVRCNSNGVLDNTFGNSGKSTIDFGGDDYARSVAVQSNGYMVVSGYTKQSTNLIAVTKLGPLGNRVSNFGVSGKVTTLIGNSCAGSSVVIQPDKKIIVAGNASVPNNDQDFALVRYNTDGSPDNSFGTSGTVTTDFTPVFNNNQDHRDDYGRAVAIQQDGKIVVAGEHVGYDNYGYPQNDVIMARYNGDPVSQPASSENISAATDKTLSTSTIKLFPNPAKDLLNINGMDASSTKIISIVDMNGGVLQTTTTANGTHTWNIASLPAGTYYLLIDDNKKKMSLKFVKE